MHRWSEPVAALAGKSAQLWTAEAVGGASRINAGLVTRGAKAVYDRWERDFGLTEWGGDTMEEWFRKTEKAVGREGSSWRGQDGLMECREARPQLSLYR
jgi:choline dehydrogenase-like flavoprotein